MEPDALKRTALVFASSDGGVVYTRKFFAEIVERGEGAGSPLLFPETVYNAPASHIAARLGLECEVLTLVGDAAAGLSAVQTACELIAAGEAESCVIAAAQELDWITCEAYQALGPHPGRQQLSLHLFRRSSRHRSHRKTACLRILATHPGYSYSTEAEADKKFETMLTELLQRASVDLFVSCASGTRFDLPERKCIAKHLPFVRILTPKSALGESFACSTLQQIITGVLALEESGRRKCSGCHHRLQSTGGRTDLDTPTSCCLASRWRIFLRQVMMLTAAVQQHLAPVLATAKMTAHES